MKKIHFSLTLFFVLLLSSNLLAQSHLDKGWDYFNVNKLDDARDEFYDAAKNPKTAVEAYLSSAIVNTVDKKTSIPIYIIIGTPTSLFIRINLIRKGSVF